MQFIGVIYIERDKTYISRLEENPHPSRFGKGPETAMFEYIADKVGFKKKKIPKKRYSLGDTMAFDGFQRPQNDIKIS